MELSLAPRLVETCESTSEGRAWLACLPARVAELVDRWSLSIDTPRGGEGATCSFVAFVRRADGTPAALKIGLPHMEAEQEADGLHFWAGAGAVELLESDPASGGMLLERCEPGAPLSALPAPEQDAVLAGLLRRLWRVPTEPHPFRPLSAMVRCWADAALARQAKWPDPGFARAQVERLLELSRPADTDVLLATDLHAGNVLRARREPWLVIDPKPFIGDAAYDATQHLLNGLPRLSSDPHGIVSSFSELLGVSSERVRSWLCARLAQAARADRRGYGLTGSELVQLARRLDRAR